MILFGSQRWFDIVLCERKCHELLASVKMNTLNSIYPKSLSVLYSCIADISNNIFRDDT